MDLYARDLGPPAFRRLCGGNQQEEEGESCVEIAPVPGAIDAFALRDSKNPDAGTLRFTGAELRAAGGRTI
ncbi:DUF397 domain-containing protein [Thermoactinospora rubra]|uniref:DUF397 domain-containing protein n=1 Tax=Thermoactinospora rubra TaxID=1088767 RepID=UPI000A10108B|nr:DUF397 domain-containing protein [Thermoactinospora rubra]